MVSAVGSHQIRLRPGPGQAVIDTAHSAAPDDDVKAIAKELRQLSNQWAKAFTHHDVAFGQRIFADDFTYIMPDGTERNKNAFLKLFRTETAGKKYTSVAITGFNVRVYGPDFAVVTGADQLKGADWLVTGATLQRVTDKEIAMWTSKFLPDRRRQMHPPMIMQGQNGGF